jgi:alginate O-acetyltransferase complex protein AlgJ
MARIFNVTYSLIFCLLVGGMALLFALQINVQEDQAFKRVEQRTPAELHFVGWQPIALRSYFASVERFVADRLPFRENLLRMQVAVNRSFGKFLNPEVAIMGKDGWIFLGNNFDRGIDKYRGIVRFDRQQLDAFGQYFREVSMALERQGVPFLLAVVPDKHSVYPEYLPEYFARRGESPLDQLMQMPPAGFRILDLRETLAAEKGNGGAPLYFRADSHWNELGAYVGYRKIMETLGIPVGVQASREDFTRLAIAKSGGDLVQKTGSTQPFPDEYTHLRRNFFSGVLSVEDLQKRTVRPLPANDMTRITDMNSYRTTNTGREGTLLVIGDSTTENMSRYLNNSFGQVVYQHYLSFGSHDIPRLASQYRPRAVVYLMVERNLTTPVNHLIPAEDRPAKMTTQGKLSANAGAVPHSPQSAVISNQRLLAESSQVHEIADIRIENGDLLFRATGFDPYFHLPPVAPMPAGAVISLELTLPGERMVQLFYQTQKNPQITEEQSFRTPLPAGRHLIQWRVPVALDGRFRLDPGNAPGVYRIHRLEISP